MLTSDQIRELQQGLIRMGYDLPRWGADGRWGDESRAALNRFLTARYPSTPAWGEPTIAELERVLESAQRQIEGNQVPKPNGYVDRRSHASLQHDTGARPWLQTTGVCLHQTACVMGESLDRYNALGAHFAVTRAGKVIHLHDLTRVIMHGNGFNTRTVGIEVDGLFEGVEGDPRTLWDNPATAVHERGMMPTDVQLERTRQLIRWIGGEIAAHGGRFAVLVAHRQAHKSRRNDPGSTVWREVALPMMAELGLSDGGIGFSIGGYSIPELWDPRCKGQPY